MRRRKGINEGEKKEKITKIKTYPCTFRALISSSGSGGSLTGVFGDNVTCNSFVPSTSTTTSLVSFLMPLLWDLDFFDL